VLIANSNLVPHWATWEHFNELDRKGLMMYGQMTAGSWIYIGSAGHRAGHLRDLRRDGPPALWRRPAGQVDPDRGPGRHGRRAAAGRDDGRRLVLAVECQPSRIEMRLRTRYLDVRPRRSTRRWR
jgi:urocanate hydratase